MLNITLFVPIGHYFTIVKFNYFQVQKTKTNSKFQVLETARILKKTTKFGPKNITQIKQT